jgi:hypothetical protein
MKLDRLGPNKTTVTIGPAKPLSLIDFAIITTDRFGPLTETVLLARQNLSLSSKEMCVKNISFAHSSTRHRFSAQKRNA